MDLIVHMPSGSVQSVSGVNETTTCAQIIYALLQATHQKGSFSLVSRTNEPINRFMPTDRPYEFVQESYRRGLQIEFELQRLDKTGSVSPLEFTRDLLEESKSISSSNTTLNDFFNYYRKNTPLESADQTKCRPPPPDYNDVMAERCNSLRRIPSTKKPCPLTFLNIPNFSLHDLYSHRFSKLDLEALIEMQEKTLTAQKGELVRVELTLLDSTERELVQLRKQHNNLQTVLNSMRNANLLNRISAESAEAERLHTAIAAMRTALAEKKRELYEAVQLQLTMEKQLARELSINEEN